MSILAIPFPIYQPAMRIISDITNGFPAVVTTTFNHQYLSGLIVRLNIPEGYGMVQVNQLTGTIVVISDTSFEIDLDTTYFDAFTTPGTYPLDAQYPQVVPIGEVNESLRQSTQNVLPY